MDSVHSTTPTARSIFILDTAENTSPSASRGRQSAAGNPQGQLVAQGPRAHKKSTRLGAF